MARFTVYRNAEGVGYLMDVQADLISHLNTRVVVPLLPLAEAPRPAATLNPVFEIEGGSVVMVTQFMAAVPVQMLKQPVASLALCHGPITAALDVLFQGF